MLIDRHASFKPALSSVDACAAARRDELSVMSPESLLQLANQMSLLLIRKLLPFW